MKIYILECNDIKVNALKEAFKGQDVEVVKGDFVSFMETHDVECVVSPANAFGIMDGGYDLAIRSYFGYDLQINVQEYILNHYYGEQPLGTSFIIDIKDGKKLIHTPTMRVPSKIKDPLIVYQAMRTTLMCAKENKVKSIVIPFFGTGTGRVGMRMAADLMLLALKSINHPKLVTDWSDVDDFAERLDIYSWLID